MSQRNTIVTGTIHYFSFGFYYYYIITRLYNSANSSRLRTFAAKEICNNHHFFVSDRDKAAKLREAAARLEDNRLKGVYKRVVVIIFRR